MKFLIALNAILIMAINLSANAQSLEKYLKELDPEIMVSMKLQNQKGELLFEKNSRKVVPSASIIKIPILLSLLKAKGMNLNHKYTPLPKDIVGGSGDIQYEVPFKKFTYNYLAQKMISVSDNTATNILIEKLGSEQIQDNINNWGLTNTKLNRKMMDFEAIKAGKQNFTTCEDMNGLLLKLLNQQLLSKKSGKKAMEFLLSCEDRTTIPRNIPVNIPIAHKTGTLDYVRGDAGIIFSKNILILTVFVENFESLEQAETIIGKIAECCDKDFGQ
ncbi:serine hydrolase [Lacihabitans soyangensis]|uniref:beta-lactamase n=1 Tax=Lacihabitans soyangensis TaxID=869394 RepID=A0AAE3H2Y1_9BACT|nr:serine hydrolase [Lacihabitans soyangensis]MCP9763076.1 serine hydrolase [Lacihabitans soyangensis]